MSVRRQAHWACARALGLGWVVWAICCGAVWSAELAPPAATVPAAPNSLTQATVQLGALSCASRVEQITRYVGYANGMGASVMVPAQPADQRVFALQMEIAAGAASNSLVDLNFASQQANGCGASYEAVSYWTQSCDAVATARFAQFKRVKPLQKDILLLDGGPASRVFLIQAGSGCVSVTKEIIL